MPLRVFAVVRGSGVVPAEWHPVDTAEGLELILDLIPYPMYELPVVQEAIDFFQKQGGFTNEGLRDPTVDAELTAVEEIYAARFHMNLDITGQWGMTLGVQRGAGTIGIPDEHTILIGFTPVRDGSDAIRVTSYNLLASSCNARPSVFEAEVGIPPYNLWEHRFAKLQARLIDLDSNIFLLQEVNWTMLRQLQQCDALRAYRFECSGNSEMECAIGFRRSKFRYVGRHDFTFRCLALRLVRVVDGKFVCAVSCHIKAGESKKDDRIRAEQMRQILDTVDSEDSSSMIIIGGDLNSDRSLSHLYRRPPAVLKMLEANGFSCNHDETKTYFGWDHLKFDYIYYKHCTISRPHAAAPLHRPGSSKT